MGDCMIANKTEPIADDLDLLRCYAARGGPETISALVQRHQETVFATCLRRLKCQADAEDAMQEVFLSLMENAGKIRSNVGAWLYRCAVNTSISMIRSSQKRTRHEIEKARLDFSAWRDGEAILRERVAILDACLRELDATDHKLVLQNCVMGSTQKEIASSMGITQQAVAKRIGRALVQLRRGLFARGVILSVIAAVVMLAKKVASAAVPQCLRTTFTSLPSASLTSGGAATAGTAGAVKVSAAAVLVLTAAVVTYECVEERNPPAAAPKIAAVAPVSVEGRSTEGKTVVAGSPNSRRASLWPTAFANDTFAWAPSGTQVSRSFASSGLQAIDSSTSDRQSDLVSNAWARWQPAPLPLNEPVKKVNFSTLLDHLQASPGGRLDLSGSKARTDKNAKSSTDGTMPTDASAAIDLSLADATTDGIADPTGGGDASAGLSDMTLADSGGTSNSRQRNSLFGGNFRFGGQAPSVFDTVSTRTKTWPAVSRPPRWSTPLPSVPSDNSASDDNVSTSDDSQVQPVHSLEFSNAESSPGFPPRSSLDFIAPEATEQATVEPLIPVPAITPTAAHALPGEGIIRSSDGTTIPAGTTLAAAGSISGRLINQGVVVAEGSDTPLYLTGLVSGRGSYAGNVVFTSGFSPGNSPAAVHLDDATLDSSNTLTMELAGLTPGSQYDQLIIGDHLTLGGHLDVKLLYGFMPHLGNSFDLLDGDFSGRFSDMTLPALGGGLRWDTSDLYTVGSLEVVPEPSTLLLLAVSGLGVLLRRRPA